LSDGSYDDNDDFGRSDQAVSGSIVPVDMRAEERRCIIALAGGEKIAATHMCARVSPVI
jgi:hypothetical protein